MTLKDLFDQIVTLVRETPVTPELAVSNEDKLRMYGLYKQATEGACEQTAPPVWQPVYRAKYEAWASYRDLETEVAIIRYVRVAARQNHWLGKKCRDLLEAYEQQGNSCQNNSEKDEKGNESHGDGPAATKAVVEKAPKITAPLSRRKTEPHLMERLFGLKPLIPRGQLDISYSELATAARHCLDSSSTPKRESCEQEIVELWKQQQEKSQQPKDQHVLVGLSVRSLLDLYLRAKTFMPGSEVIVVPPINIPAMMAILEYHGLAIVAVDLPESFANDHVLRIDVDQVKQAVTAKTAAIMVVHPFGIETATDSDMEQLRSLADEHGLDIIEDCAECYSGASSTTRPYADLALFSFGTIKTATALGSGVAVLRGPQLSIKMKRLHQSLYEPQTQAEFFWKVLKNAFIRLIADFPILCALILVACRWLGLDFDRLVSTSTRSFLASQQDNTPIRLIRRRPSLALLKTLKMKLRISKQIASSQKTKIQRCEKMMAMLQDCSALRWPKPVEKHSWWLAPILVTSPKETSRRLLQSGYDVPRGLSQLQCIAPACCPRAQLLMQSILYLPIASRSMTDSDMSSLAHAISVATDPDVADSKTETRPSRGYSAIAIALALVFVLWKTKSITGVLHLSISASLMAPALVLLNLAISCLLTFFIADAYLESGCFAKYNPMLRQIFDNDQKRDSQDAGLEDIPALRLPAFRTNESNQPSVLLTGATGFLGSSILHEMLMNRALMQSIDRVVLICRPKRGKSARQRINELLDQDMFSFLTKQERDEKILVLEGDTCKPDGGIAAKDLAVLFTDLKVQSVINCAASVRFSQGLDEAATANITAALYLQQLSLKLNAKFVHISTAFVHGGLTGTKSSPLTETLFSLDKFDADKIYRSMIGNQMYASLAMSTLGFHNTYTFSKCICEHLLLQTTPDDVVIVRPSIIGPALQEPFEGWAGQKPSTIVAATCLYMKFPFSVWSFGKHEASVIPVDVVARFVLAKALKGDDLASSQRLENRSECQSPASSEYEKVQGIGEVESLSSDSCSNDVDVRTAIEGFAPVICNAAWSSDSSACSSFSWYDFATSVPHVGIVLGGCPRVTAYLSFAISVKILPSLRLRAKQFAALYYFLLQVPFSAFVRLLEIAGLEKLHRKLSKLLPFLDLPVLFYPFTNNSFIFESALQAPQHLDGHRYMFTCIAAAHRFLYEMTPLSSTEKGPRTQLRDTSNILIGGKDHRKLNSDLWWALTQPRGNILVRLVGYLFAKILRSSCTAVSVDVESFAGIARQIVADDNKVVHVVLAPTHRSFYDFVLISFIAFSLPELRIQIPYIAAAQEFSSLPFLGWIIKHVNAFFVRRGRGRDPDLADQLRAMKTASKGRGTCIEVFIEGSRSRDRRFLEPKTGFLRCLVQTGGDHLIVPVCINYERVPEQDALVREGMGGTRRGLRTTGLLPWLWVRSE
jgi:dTDP-4-amino-4,6-dideoxygalactose transaminase/nucleoside-diphosphate-sugar epimerase/acyl-CoA-binding protein